MALPATLAPLGAPQGRESCAQQGLLAVPEWCLFCPEAILAVPQTLFSIYILPMPQCHALHVHP